MCVSSPLERFLVTYRAIDLLQVRWLLILVYDMLLHRHEVLGFKADTFRSVYRLVFSATAAGELLQLDLGETGDLSLLPYVGEHLLEIGAAAVVFVGYAEFKVHECFLFHLDLLKFIKPLLFVFLLLQLGVLRVPVSSAPLASLVEEADLRRGAQITLSVLVGHEFNIVPFELVVAAPDAPSGLVMHFIIYKLMNS